MLTPRDIYNRIHIYILFHSTCFWIYVGAQPYLSKSLDLNPIQYGYIRTTFALLQLVGGPLFGRFGDVYGGRYALTVAFLASTLSYFTTSIAYSVLVLFVSRLPAIFMHVMQGGQMIVTDISQQSERSDVLGKLGMSYGIGMVIGPLVGGWITKLYGERMSSAVAGFGSLIGALAVLYTIPNYTKSSATTDEKSTEFLSFATIYRLFKKDVLFLLCIKILTGLPLGIFQSMISIVAIDTFHFSAEQNGYLMAYVGILGMVIQGLGVGYLTKRFTDQVVLTASSVILIVAYLLMSYSLTVTLLLISLIPLVTGLCLTSVVISSSLTGAVPSSDTGSILGINMALNSLIRTVSPTLGGFMLMSYGVESVGVLGFCTSLLVFTVLLFKYKVS